MKPNRSEPRWPAVVAVLSTGLLFYAMPETLTVGPRWLVFVVMAVLAARVLVFGKRVPSVTVVMKEVLPDLVANEERTEAGARPDEPVLVDYLHVQLLLGL